jgi:hypothetical protein
MHPVLYTQGSDPGMVGIRQHADGHVSAGDKVLQFLFFVHIDRYRASTGVAVDECLSLTDCAAGDNHLKARHVQEIADMGPGHETGAEHKDPLHTITL